MFGIMLSNIVQLVLYWADIEFAVLCQGADGDKTVQMALKDPDRFVLKPQLEGGGKQSC